MKKVYRLALLGAVSLCGVSFAVSNVQAGKVTKEDVSEAKNHYQTVKKQATEKTPEVLEGKYNFKQKKAQLNNQEVSALLEKKDESAIVNYLSNRFNDLEAASKKAQKRPTKTFKQDKVDKLERDIKEIQKALSGSSSEKIAYLEGRSKASSTRVTAMAKKLSKLNSKK